MVPRSRERFRLVALDHLPRSQELDKRSNQIHLNPRYGSVRIDPVHYCELEDVLEERRRRKSRHGNEEDVPAVRLQLLATTLKDRHWLGSQVKFLKLPYMTRETRKADLARAISACPNLEYCDLPQGFYNGDPSCVTLRQEMQTHCPNIRRMKYNEGTEQLFQLLHRCWQRVEVLELSKLKLEASTLRTVLASLPALRELKIMNVPCFNDEIFNVAPQVPNFPPLQSLILEKCRCLTAAGLNYYLERPETRKALTNLSLSNTGVSIAELSSVLWSATHLQNLAYVATVSQSLPLEPLTPLMSITLQTLKFEITPTDDHLVSGLPKPSASYYSYLLSSLLSNSLPALKVLYVRDSGFPDALTLAPPQPSFAGGGPPRSFSQPLEVYTKGLEESEWIFNSVTPSDIPGRPGSSSGGRPMSAYSASRGLGPQWGGEARRSVVVGNGFGGFLAVPAEEASPSPRSMGSDSRPNSSSSGKSGWFGHKRGSSAQEKRASRADLWR
jgi:hypothetical protein